MEEEIQLLKLYRSMDKKCKSRLMQHAQFLGSSIGAEILTHQQGFNQIFEVEQVPNIGLEVVHS